MSRSAIYSRVTRLGVPAPDLFRWHARPGAFERLLPPWEPVRLMARDAPLADGSRVRLRIGRGPFRLSWVAEHRDVEPDRSFTDVQTRGPFARWEHRHEFRPDGPEASILEDRIEFTPPLGPLGAAFTPLIRRRLERMFAYRHRITSGDLAAHRAAGTLAATPEEARRVLVTGASGLLGSALRHFLATGGHRVLRLGRRPSGPDGFVWSPEEGVVDPAAFEDLDAVVHLAGENIGAGRWNAARRRALLESRVQSTGLLCAALARLSRRPPCLLSASAIGFYGNRGDEELTEGSAGGRGFLAEVCRAWEEATRPARAAGIRVVHLRIGVVLTLAGGALPRMLPPFRLGLGGRLGHGRQWMSWIALEDLLYAIAWILARPEIEGPVNACAPPVTNAEFTRALARALGRPAPFAVPAAALRAILGGFAEEALLASTRARPAKLAASGFAFRYPTIDDALRHALGKETR